MELILDQNLMTNGKVSRNEQVFGEKIGIMGKIFGCWHRELSRPFTNKRSSYRSCLSCGAMKRFDTESLKTFGPFYHPPVVSPETVR